MSLLRVANKTLAWALNPTGPDDGPGIFFITYHYLDTAFRSEVGLDSSLFLKQLAFLQSEGDVISYEEACRLLQNPAPLARKKFVLTFDDGHASFYDRVHPLLVERSLPAMLFVCTGFIEKKVRLADGKAMTWAQVKEVAKTPGIEIGSHTVNHTVMSASVPLPIIQEELSHSQAILQDKLGLPIPHFAYPKGFASIAARRACRELYETAVSGFGGRVLPDALDEHALPRLPVTRSDGMLFFKSKIRGGMGGERALINPLKQVFHFTKGWLGR